MWLNAIDFSLYGRARLAQGVVAPRERAIARCASEARHKEGQT